MLFYRDYSDREDDVRRDKDGSGPQWRTEMQDYERSGRELDRSNSKESYKDFNEYKDRRNDSDRKPLDSAIEHCNRTAADKLTEVFERKSIGLVEPFAPSNDIAASTQPPERRITPPLNNLQRETFDKDFSKASWAEVAQEELSNSSSKLTTDRENSPKQNDLKMNDGLSSDTTDAIKTLQNTMSSNSSIHINLSTQNQSNSFHNNHISNIQAVSPQIQQTHIVNTQVNIHPATVSSVNQPQSSIFSDSHSISNSIQSPPKILNTPETSQIQRPLSEQVTSTVKLSISSQKPEKEFSESESIASKSSIDHPSGLTGKLTDSNSVENIQDSQKRSVDDKKSERYSNEQLNKIPMKEPIERKSSGSGSEKKGRGYAGSSGYVYSRGWGPRESRGRRSHRSSRSNNRASESDGSTDGTNAERKERRRAPRSPRGSKKQDRPDDANLQSSEQGIQISDGLENREPFAPRGQPSRRGRGGFQGSNRPPAPAKRVAGYGPPNTKSPFSQANRIKDNEEMKDNVQDDKEKSSKIRPGSSAGKGRRTKGPHSGEDENWETTSEHSESGGAGNRRSNGGRQSGQSQKSGPGQNRTPNSMNRQNNGRGQQAAKKEDENKTDLSEAISELKISSAKKDEEIADDGFQKVLNKKNSKETRGPSTKEEKQPRSRSNQGSGRNGSSSRNPNEKSNSRGSAPVASKSSTQYDRPRQANLAPRFVKQRQKQQMGLVSSFAPDTGAAPPPPPVNAWDKPIAQTLRGNIEEPPEVVETKSNQSSQRSTPGEAPNENKNAVPPPCPNAADKTGVLDGSTPPVETIIFENTNYKTAPPAEALKQKYQPSAATAKPQEEVQNELEPRTLPFNGDVRPRPRSIQELMADTGRPVSEAEGTLGLPITFDTSQKTEDSSDMKLDFAFDSDLGQLTEDKSTKTLGLPRGTHMSTSNTISPLAADLNLKIASVKKVWEMPAVAEGSEELQFAGFEESNTETGAPPNVCKVKPTQQLQSPPPQHYNHVSYQGGYGGLSVPSPPAVLFNSSQQILGSSQQLQQQGGLYGAFLDQTRGQFGGFPGSPYGAGSATPYNYQPPPDMFQGLPSQYRMVSVSSTYSLKIFYCMFL